MCLWVGISGSVFVLQVDNLACELVYQMDGLACGLNCIVLLSLRSLPNVFSILQVAWQLGLWVAFSEVRASCLLCITGGQVGQRVALSEVRASCILCITGGQLGLWVGISAITMCELLDLLAQVIKYLFVRGKRKVDSDIIKQYPIIEVKTTECRKQNVPSHGDQRAFIWTYWNQLDLFQCVFFYNWNKKTSPKDWLLLTLNCHKSLNWVLNQVRYT